MADWITFGLAFAGFVMLAADAARRLCGRRSRALTAAAAGVITAHVCCVWGLRFGWSLTAMLDKGVAAFALFDAAYAAIVTAVFSPEPRCGRLVVAAFAVVCVGALPAPFRYEELAALRVPVVAVPVAAAAYWLRQRRR